MTDNTQGTALSIERICKSFDGRVILDDISFSVKKGEVFGLLGPNGAGKTTMIRVMLDILRPDSGKVEMLGERISNRIKERIGYLPEEGGLYRDTSVFDCIRYFASLKGKENVEQQIDHWLGRLKLQDYRKKPLKELSKGLYRQVQFIISVIHDPDVLILDEPFYGLDPVNKEVVKDILLELKKKGMTVIMSTHQMDEVERMCDRALMINKGKKVLYGSMDDIKGGRGLSIIVEYEGKLPKLNGIERRNDYGNYVELMLGRDTDSQRVLKDLAKEVRIRRFEVKARSLNEIFIEVVKDEK